MWLSSKLSLFLPLFVFTILSSSSSLAQQAPGGVGHPKIWHAPENDTTLIANRKSFDLHQLDVLLQNNPELLENAVTYFFVLQPAFSQSTGAEFIRFGNVAIYDDRIEYGHSSEALNFSNGEALIISIIAPRTVSYARRIPMNAEIMDSSLFSIAEVIVYDKRLNRPNIHLVNSHLALKYSITITQNSERKYRDYTQADSSLYWSSVIDRMFDQRVIGVGRSQDERFNQTQTRTSYGDWVQVSLDTAKSQGEMPAVAVDEDAFLIFSERASTTASYFECPNAPTLNHPLKNWKFRLYDWSSTATYLLVQIQKPKGQIEDSLYLYDGYQYWHLPVLDLGDRLQYTIYFDMLQEGRHYFFTTPQSMDCDPPYSVIISGNTLDASYLDGTWTLETQSLNTGVVTASKVSGASYTKSLDAGQHIVTIRNSEGEEILTKVVLVTDENAPANRTEPSIKVYPNPVRATLPTTLDVTNLSDAITEITVLITDNNGRVLSSESMTYQKGLNTSLHFPTVGLYHVTLLHGNTSYTLKVVVGQ